ncbi:MAG: tRNA (guanosine(46)-N7)-methyltransferase TrmB [Kiritimatiellia bacterium]|jgi:tRNA (guanine-N(7)-)-methyltransferase
MRCWWANQDKTYAEETAGGFLWCPQRRSNGTRNPFYENVRLTRPGDILFAFARGAIRAVGIVLERSREAVHPGALPPAPGGQAGSAPLGWLLPVAWIEIKHPLEPRNVMDVLAPLLPSVHSPLTPEGRGIQGGRLLKLPDPLANALLQLVGGASPDQLLHPVWRPRQLILPHLDLPSPAAGTTAEEAADAAAAREEIPMDAPVPRDPAAPLAGRTPDSRMIAVDVTKPFPFYDCFDPSRRVEVDVGCGKGRFLIARATAYPDIQFLGIERQLVRIRKIDKKLCRIGLSNVRLLRLEASYAIEYLLPDDAIDRFYVLFPDPWPKRRHHKHRLFRPAFLDTVWKRLRDGGDIQVATDNADYFQQIVNVFAADSRFLPATPFDRPPEEQTDFEILFRSKDFPIHAAAWSVRKPAAP